MRKKKGLLGDTCKSASRPWWTDGLSLCMYPMDRAVHDKMTTSTPDTLSVIPSITRKKDSQAPIKESLRITLPWTGM